MSIYLLTCYLNSFENLLKINNNSTYAYLPSQNVSFFKLGTNIKKIRENWKVVIS